MRCAILCDARWASYFIEQNDKKKKNQIIYYDFCNFALYFTGEKKTIAIKIIIDCYNWETGDKL